jgi:DNA-binding SARP family transcriptional activator
MSQIEFRLLGPVGVWSDGDPLGPTTPQQCGILAMLLLDMNRVVSMERMLHALWGERPTESARNAVQGYVSKLRRILAPFPDVEIATSPQGYSLRADREQVDLYRFRRLTGIAQDTDAAHASELLREALELWQGPALTGVAGQWLPCRIGAHMEEERLSALEEHAAALIEVGRLHEAVVELMPLAVEHPLRERAASLLMAALHRSGRRADALMVFHDTRHHLVRELGVEPGSVLRRTHQQVLRDRLEAPHGS